MWEMLDSGEILQEGMSVDCSVGMLLQEYTEVQCTVSDTKEFTVELQRKKKSMRNQITGLGIKPRTLHILGKYSTTELP